jgi:hypothetical protein
MANWLQTWLDNLCTVMGVTDLHGRQVHSFTVFERNELPDAITPEMVPCAVSYVSECRAEYSLGGPTLLFWSGQTEFHLTTDVKPANIPYVLTFFEKVITAAAGNMKLSGTVELFLINSDASAMQFATFRNAEGRDDHQGIVVRWNVKQPISGQLTVSA